MQCPRCGYQNALGIATCGRCGLSLAGLADQQQDQQPPSGPPSSPQPSGQSPPEQPPGYGSPGPPQGPPPGYQPRPYGPPSPYGPPTPYGPPGGPPPSPYGPPPPYGQPSPYSGGPPSGPGYSVPPGSVPPGYGAPPGYGPPPGYPGGYGGAPSGGTASSVWTTSDTRSVRPSVGPIVALVVAAAAGFGYAGWALFHRHGIFKAFANGTSSLTVDDAKSSDNIDSVLLIVAFLIIATAVSWWILLRVGGRTSGSGLELGGFAAVTLGLILAVIGLIMSAGVSTDGTQRDEGNKAASAAILYGLGFAVIAIGLGIGAVSLRRATSAAVPPAAVSFAAH
jgi:hypothetical protein